MRSDVSRKVHVDVVLAGRVGWFHLSAQGHQFDETAIDKSIPIRKETNVMPTSRATPNIRIGTDVGLMTWKRAGVAGSYPMQHPSVWNF
jgi:hypothetical protein